MMVIVVGPACPASLRGLLSTYGIKIDRRTWLSGIGAKQRDQLWERIRRCHPTVGCLQAWSDRTTPSGYAWRAHDLTPAASGLGIVDGLLLEVTAA